MANKEILALLQQKFGGARKDSLSMLAAMLTTMQDEEAQKFIETLDAARLEEFSHAYRKSVDSEISKATQSAEQNLRAKFDFVEKSQQQPATTDPQQNQQQPDMAALIRDAISSALAPVTAELESLKLEKATASRLSMLNEFLNSETSLPDTYKDVVRNSFSAQKFENDNLFNVFLEDQKKSAQKFKQELIDKGFAGVKPLGARVNSDGVSAGVELYLKNSQSEEFKGKQL